MAVTFSLFNQFKADIMNGTHDLDSDTFKVALLSGYSFDATDTVFSDVSGDEISGTHGYTSGGAALSNAYVGQTSGTGKWDADDVSWTASGGTLSATGAIVYNTSKSNKLVGYQDFGTTESAGSGAQLVIQWNASGLLTDS